MTFADLRKAAFYGQVLDTDQFAEEVTLREPGRQDRAVTVKISSATESQANGQQRTKTDRIHVAAGNDETYPIKSGIAEPTRKTKIVRAGETDAYVYSGKTIEAYAHGWLLEFVRVDVDRVGKR